MDDELHEIEQTTRDLLKMVHTVADRVLPPENARAMLLGIAAVMIRENMKHGEEPGPAEINNIWAERNFPWRMVRLQ